MALMQLQKILRMLSSQTHRHKITASIGVCPYRRRISLANLIVIYEPSKEDIIKSITPKYFNTQIWQYLLESFASEQAARMIAMENATENAKEMIDDLNLEFNKARQTAITTEMLEIVGGAEALSN